MQLDPEPSPSLMTQRSWAAPSSPDGEAYSPPTTDADTIGDPAAATSTARLDDDETKATASESSAPGRSMSLRPKASCGPPVIPPEILEWARAPPKRRKTGKRKRARTWAEAKVKLNRLGLLKWGCPPLAPGTVVFLFGRASDAIVCSYDQVRQAYRLLLLNEERHVFEKLHGAGHANWDLVQEVVEPEPAEETSAAAVTHATGSADGGSAQCRPRVRPRANSWLAEHCADDELESCIVCTDPLDDDPKNPVGTMPCCGSRVHQRCAARWRASNNNMRAPTNGSLKYVAPDTRACMFCRNADATRYCSTRRMFGIDASPPRRL